MNPLPVVPSAPAPPVPEVILAPQPENRWQALRQAGWWTNSDWMFLVVAIATGVTGTFWRIFAKPELLQILILMTLLMTIFTMWLVTLAYRCMDFVLQLRARVEMMPFDAARIAVGYLQGGKPLITPVAR